jgi:[FeFe] hydrogenase H-cluster maturation GTPase HydF
VNKTPVANRVCIGFFGKRNSGKSSLINAVTGQSLAVVSDVPGTTTDPVYKTMELLPVGPVMLVDTAGIDDEGMLGTLRVDKTYDVLKKTDVAVLVVDGQQEISEEERELIRQFTERNIPFLVAVNKADAILPESCGGWEDYCKEYKYVTVSALQGTGINDLKVSIGQLACGAKQERPLVSDLVEKGGLVILVTPIDGAAPKGRLILPQQQTIRDLLEKGAMTMVVQPDELPGALSACGKKPKLVITDSQVFGKVDKMVPEDILLTSFSVLFARYKGILDEAVAGAKMLESLCDGDKILISEGCTHHRQCGDIGTEKLPKWILDYTGKRLEFEWTSETQFPTELTGYRLVIHCGGCMLNDKEMGYRSQTARSQNVPMTNYGTAIAHINGILERSIKLK